MAHKDNNKYYQLRKECGLSREAAVRDLFDYKISTDRLFRIEDGKTPTPEEICIMAAAYNSPELKNYYCKNECKIGITNGISEIGDVHKEHLPKLVLELLSSLNSIEKDKLIDISADGEIDIDELTDFAEIRKQLDKISQTVESLRLWADKNIG